MKPNNRQLIGSLSHYLQGFIHPRWCKISAINSRILKGPGWFHSYNLPCSVNPNLPVPKRNPARVPQEHPPNQRVVDLAQKKNQADKPWWKPIFRSIDTTPSVAACLFPKMKCIGCIGDKSATLCVCVCLLMPLRFHMDLVELIQFDQYPEADFYVFDPWDSPKFF